MLISLKRILNQLWWWYVGGPLWRHTINQKMTIKGSNLPNKAWKMRVVCPVFQTCLSYSSDTQQYLWTNQIPLFHWTGVYLVFLFWFAHINKISKQFSKYWTDHSFFHALFGRCTTFYGHFMVDGVTSEGVHPHTIILLSIHYILNIITNKKLQYFY